MVNNYTIRRFELALVPTVAAAYVAQSLLYDAARFEDKINAAREEGVSVQKILQDLIPYDHTWNHNMPVIVAATIFLMAWYLFHFLFFPKLQERKLTAALLTVLTIDMGLILSGTFILLNTINVDVRSNAMGQIIGLNDVTHFRLKFVLSDSVAILSLLCLYEILSQLYYKLYEKLEIEPNGRALNYIIVFLISALALTVMVSQRLIPNLMHSVGIRQLLAIIPFGITVYCLQEHYIQKMYPAFHNPSRPTDFYLPFLTHFLILGAGTALITAIMLRFFYISLPTQIIIITGLYAFSLAISYYRKDQQQVKAQLTTQVSNKSAELTSLRAQINPHFLFNALNSLYATALIEKGEKTADGIQKLGDMMRFMLHENNHDRIPLSSEIEYLHNYIALQRMRLDETQNIEIRVNIQEAEREIYIAPMLLNPFIENAFKHGISFQNPSWIYITLTMDATRIYFKVHNSIHKTPIHDPEEGRSGIGLENVQKRLHLIYPDKHTLEIQKSERDYFIALTLNW